MRFLSLLPLTMLIAAAPPEAPVERPRVAIIDSGVARTAELSDRVIAEYDIAASPARPAFQPRYDHGTMVATILSRAADRQVDIISLRIDDPGGCPQGANPPCTHNPRTVAAAIRRATKLGVDAINLSLALSDHPAIVSAVREAAAKGIYVVMAAGNDGLDRPNNLHMARAAYPRAVLVGALDAAGAPWAGTNHSASTPVDYNYVWQLGVAVPTAFADGRQVAGTGTSFAAPFETARLVTQTAAPRSR